VLVCESQRRQEKSAATAKSGIKVVEILEATTGGTRRHLFDLVMNLDPARFALSIVCATRRDPAFQADLAAFRDRGLPVTVVPMVRELRPWADLSAWRQIRRYLIEKRPEVVHTHSSKAGFVGRLAARSARIPFVVHTPHHFAFDMEIGGLRRAFYLQLERWAARYTDRFICVCPAEKAAALRRRLAVPDKFTVIENGIGPTATAPDPAAVERWRREIGLPPNAPLIGAVGRLTRQKGHADLLRAMPAVLCRFPNARLVLAGDGELHRALVTLAAALDLSRNVIFAGQREDVLPLYPLLDVLAMPSLWEGLPYTLLEGMAAGRAIVASAVGGVPDVLRQGESGFLVPPHAPAALAEAVCGLLADAELRNRLGVNARKVVAQQCRLEEMVARTAAVYAACGAKETEL